VYGNRLCSYGSDIRSNRAEICTFIFMVLYTVLLYELNAYSTPCSNVKPPLVGEQACSAE